MWYYCIIMIGRDGWIAINKKWKDKTKTEGPSLRLWWIVTNEKLKKRWIVKNLKAFCAKHYRRFGDDEGTHRWRNGIEMPWREKAFYNDLSRWGSSYPNWIAKKPTKHIYVYNLLGTKDLSLFKKAYEKEIPFSLKEYNMVCKTGILPEIKQFWKDVDFTI